MKTTTVCLRIKNKSVDEGLSLSSPKLRSAPLNKSTSGNLLMRSWNPHTHTHTHTHTSGDFYSSWKTIPRKKNKKQNEYASTNKPLTFNVTAFIKGRVLALLRTWQSWQWVTPFRRGFALCSIISHYYMSHLLPRIPMGEEETHTLKHTHTHVQMIPGMQHIAPIAPEKPSNTLWRPAKRELPFHDNLHPPPQLDS